MMYNSYGMTTIVSKIGLTIEKEHYDFSGARLELK